MSSNHQILLAGAETFIPITATGGTVTDITISSKSYRRHVFTGPGTFEVTARGTTTDNNLDVLLVAGGGSGGVDNGGGGGAGGLIDTSVTPAVQQYPISIGAGAAKRVGSSDDGPGNKGNNSTAFSLTALGGGAGTGWQNAGDNGTPGGSGAGQGMSPSAPAPGPGTATQPGSPSGGFGNNGAAGTIGPQGGRAGGGGGAGGAASGMLGGAAYAVAAKYGPGVGYTSNGTGLAGGGSGGSEAADGQPVGSNNGVPKSTSSGSGPLGPQGTYDENDCLANSGAGGHGSNHPNNLSSGAGGPGICVVRYKLER